MPSRFFSPLITYWVDVSATAWLPASSAAVISSDTSTAHLAGALGVPTWALLHYAADWRWMQDDATAWYPGMRVFRQREPGAWAECIDRMRDELARLARRPVAERTPVTV